MKLSLQEKNRQALKNFLQWRQEKLKREQEQEELLPEEPETEENFLDNWILKY